jgi:phosphatidylinositol glycan class N
VFHQQPSSFRLIFFNFKLAFNVISILNVVIVRSNLFGNKMFALNQITSYVCLLVPFVMPTLLPTNNVGRLFYFIFSLFNVYFHLSVSYESLFVICLTIEMVSWLSVESHNYTNQFSIQKAFNMKKDENIYPTEYSARKPNGFLTTFRVYSLFFHILIAFFGTGNIASINSFDVVSVYCFSTIFNPFLMGFLLFVKILIPFLIVISIYYFISNINTNTLSLNDTFVLLMVIADALSLQFFFLIRTTGSWLDIGTSISHYVISTVTIIFIVILFYIVNFIFTFNATAVYGSVAKKFIR